MNKEIKRNVILVVWLAVSFLVAKYGVDLYSTDEFVSIPLVFVGGLSTLAFAITLSIRLWGTDKQGGHAEGDTPESVGRAPVDKLWITSLRIRYKNPLFCANKCRWLVLPYRQKERITNEQSPKCKDSPRPC